MKDIEILELNTATEDSERVEEIVRSAGIRGLSCEKAKELGLFDRISNLLALMTMTYSAAYRVYGGIDSLLSDLGIKKHEIKKNCTDFEKAFERFLSFWKREEYFVKEGEKDLNEDMQALGDNLMKWSQLPREWNLGDPQKIYCDCEDIIRVDDGKNILKLKRSVEKKESVGDVEEQWIVTRYDVETTKQEIVHNNMTKADAMVIAKRLSTDDPTNVYTATIIQTFVEKRVEAVPMRAYMANKSVGNARKVMKD